LEILGKHGVTPIVAKGEPFDPQKHEAIAQMETEEHPPNSVIEEHHKGYFLFDRLLRPSLVTTAKPLETKEENQKGRELENDESDD
jgi:molecular chaperone GrpE